MTLFSHEPPPGLDLKAMHDQGGFHLLEQCNNLFMVVDNAETEKKPPNLKRKWTPLSAAMCPKLMSPSNCSPEVASANLAALNLFHDAFVDDKDKDFAKSGVDSRGHWTCPEQFLAEDAVFCPDRCKSLPGIP